MNKKARRAHYGSAPYREEIAEADLAGVDIAAAGATSWPSREYGVGAEGGRRRQIRDPATYPANQRVEAAMRYAEADIEALSVRPSSA